MKNGSWVSNMNDLVGGTTFHHGKRKSRFKFGYINNNHVFSGLQFTISIEDIISTGPFTVKVLR